MLVIGQEVNGAKRWINLAGIQFQPSEVAKFTMILLFARLTRRYGQDARQFRYGVLGFGGALMGILLPLALEKHLSAIMLMGMVAVVMMFVAGTSPKWLLAGAGAALLFVVGYVSVMGYAGDRITAWLHPEQIVVGAGAEYLYLLLAQLLGPEAVFAVEDPGYPKIRQVYGKCGAVCRPVALDRRGMAIRHFYLRLIIGVLPAVVLGFTLNEYIEKNLGNVTLVAVMLIVGGVFMLFCDRLFNKGSDSTPLTLRRSFIIGCFQCIS